MNRNDTIMSFYHLLERDANKLNPKLKDDLVNIAVVNIIEHWDYFDPTLGYKPSTYFVKVGLSAMKNWLRDREYFRKPLEPFDYEHVSKSEQPDEIAARNEILQAMRDCFVRIPWKFKRILIMRYEQGLTFAECGKQLGVSRTRAQQMAVESENVLKRITQTHAMLAGYAGRS